MKRLTVTQRRHLISWLREMVITAETWADTIDPGRSEETPLVAKKLDTIRRAADDAVRALAPQENLQ